MRVLNGPMQSWKVLAPGSVSQDRLVMTEVAEPLPLAGELVIEVAACAMCRTDLQIVEGDLPAHQLPVTPGHQVVGTVVAVGSSVDQTRVGQRVGLAWIASACERCRFCLEGRENLCPEAKFTGWDVDGGYAGQVVAKAEFAFDLSVLGDRSSVSIAPMMCAGVIGYRALRIAGVGPGDAGRRVGLYGFGASARQVLQMLRFWGIDTYVASRTRTEADQAMELGALWAGLYDERPPVPLDAAITFAPAGSVVIAALRSLDRGGVVAINAIHLDEVPSFAYDDLWLERSLRSVANVTRRDVVEFIDLVAQADLHTEFERLSFAEANDGLRRMKAGELRGSFVLV